MPKRVFFISDFISNINHFSESEKTAIIMTGISLKMNILKTYIWMATGSMNLLKIEHLKRKGYIIRSSKLSEYITIDDEILKEFDLADFILK